MFGLLFRSPIRGAANASCGQWSGRTAFHLHFPPGTRVRFCIAASAPVSVTCRYTAGSHRTSNGYKLSQIMFTIELLLHSRTLGTVSGRSDTPPPLLFHSGGRRRRRDGPAQYLYSFAIRLGRRKAIPRKLPLLNRVYQCVSEKKRCKGSRIARGELLRMIYRDRLPTASCEKGRTNRERGVAEARARCFDTEVIN